MVTRLFITFSTENFNFISSTDSADDSSQNKYKCAECPKEFHTEKGFLTHCSFHHGQKARKKYEIYILLF